MFCCYFLTLIILRVSWVFFGFGLKVVFVLHLDVSHDFYMDSVFDLIIHTFFIGNKQYIYWKTLSYYVK